MQGKESGKATLTVITIVVLVMIVGYLLWKDFQKDEISLELPDDYRIDTGEIVEVRVLLSRQMANDEIKNTEEYCEGITGTTAEGYHYLDCGLIDANGIYYKVQSLTSITVSEVKNFYREFYEGLGLPFLEVRVFTT